MKVLAGILFAIGLCFLVLLLLVLFDFDSPLSKADLISRVASAGVMAIAFFAGSATTKYLSG